MMNFRSIFVLAVIFVSAFLMSGCDEGLSFEIFGAPGVIRVPSSDSSVNSQNNQASSSSSSSDKKCISVPNTYYDKEKDSCECIDKYKMTSNGCISESSVECTFDQDCSPSGNTKSSCQSSTSKIVYRCDIKTYKCLAPETVNCKDYGANYVCTGGQCIYNPTPNLNP